MPWKAAYPKEIRNQMIELVQAGMSPVELSRKHEPSAEAIRGWVKKAKRDEARHADSLTPNERTELTQLRQENAALRAEREQLTRVAAEFTRESANILCQALGLSPQQARNDAALTAGIRVASGGGGNGSPPRLHAVAPESRARATKSLRSAVSGSAWSQLLTVLPL